MLNKWLSGYIILEVGKAKARLETLNEMDHYVRGGLPLITGVALGGMYDYVE